MPPPTTAIERGEGFMRGSRCGRTSGMLATNQKKSHPEVASFADARAGLSRRARRAPFSGSLANALAQLGHGLADLADALLDAGLHFVGVDARAKVAAQFLAGLLEVTLDLLATL